MHHRHTKAQAQLVAKTYNLNADEVEAILSSYWKDKIAEVWHTEDVAEVAPGISADDAMAVLTAVLDNHDANIGINWDVLRFHTENLAFA